MPIYQYQCTNCGHQLEALQKMSDPKLVDCPKCESASLKKQVTAAAFKLNGTGWYETDFKHSGKKPSASNDSAKSAPQSSDAKAGSDTKTAASDS